MPLVAMPSMKNRWKAAGISTAALGKNFEGLDIQAVTPVLENGRVAQGQKSGSA